MLATPILNSGPGAYASPTPHKARKEAQTITQDGNEASLEERGDGLPQGRQPSLNPEARKCPRAEGSQKTDTKARTATVHTTQTLRKPLRPAGTVGAGQQPGTDRAQSPRQRLHKQVPRKHRPQKRIGQGPPPLLSTGAWQNRHSVRSFFESSASICCI